MAESQDNTQTLEFPATEQMQEPVVQPASTSEPQAPPAKMTPEQFQEKLRKGEIDTSRTDPEAYIKELVDFGEASEDVSRETPEAGLGTQPTEAPQEQSVAKKESEKAADRKFYKSVGEILHDVKEETGEQLPDAYGIVEVLKSKKEQTEKQQAAIEKWKNDATAANSKMTELLQKLEAQQQQIEAAEKRFKDLETKATQPQAPAESVSPRDKIAAEIPEPPKPDFDEATPKEISQYYEAVRNRDALIARKEQEVIFDKLRKEQEDRELSWQQKLADQNRQSEQIAEQQKKAEAEKRRLEDATIAAEDFRRNRPEFDFGDGSTIAQKNEQYIKFLQDIDYIKGQNPALANEQTNVLAAKYLNGDADAARVIDAYQVKPPAGAKQFALLAELNALANRHGLVTETGRPDFNRAYVLKKHEDGVDVDEMNQAVAKATDNVLNVVQNRQAAPQQITSKDAVIRGDEGMTQQQLQDKMETYRKNQSRMTPEQRAKTIKEIEAEMADLNIMPDVPGARL